MTTQNNPLIPIPNSLLNPNNCGKKAGQNTLEYQNGLMSNCDALRPQIISATYTYTLDALPHLEHRIRYGSLTTTQGQPIPDLYAFIRAVEAGEF